MLRVIAITVLFFFLSGCKLAVIVAEGGKVVTGSGNECLAGNVCRYAVPDTNYADTFTAVPDVGWEFAGWSGGNKRLCPNEGGNLCALDATTAGGTPLEALVEGFIASAETFYLEPVFTCSTADCGDVSPSPSVACDLNGQVLNGLTNAVTLRGCNLHSADLTNARLSGVDLSGSDLSFANMNHVELNNANLNGAKLRDTDLSYGNLSGADLRGADLLIASLRATDLTGADLTGADLRYAVLTGADLRGADLTSADLTGADLGVARWGNTTCPDGSNSDQNPDCGF